MYNVQESVLVTVNSHGLDYVLLEGIQNFNEVLEERPIFLNFESIDAVAKDRFRYIKDQVICLCSTKINVY